MATLDIQFIISLSTDNLNPRNSRTGGPIPPGVGPTFLRNRVRPTPQAYPLSMDMRNENFSSKNKTPEVPKMAPYMFQKWMHIPHGYVERELFANFISKNKKSPGGQFGFFLLKPKLKPSLTSALPEICSEPKLKPSET